MKEDLTVKPIRNLEEILARAKGFLNLEEENAHHWGSASRGRESRRETNKRMKRDQYCSRS